MSIDYQTLLDEAMLGIVRKILLKVQEVGLEDEQCFYISFHTDFPEVILSRHVKQRYPKEITIVLQYQFRDLRVLNDRFTVNIAFGGLPETIQVPFDALTSFVDPSANFSLQFKHTKKIDKPLKLEKPKKAELKKINSSRPSKISNITKTQKPGQVVAIDQFRKKFDS